ncbi:13720_t:CDS:1, partial [Entrophospora sp. SA101]
ESKAADEEYQKNKSPDSNVLYFSLENENNCLACDLIYIYAQL